MLKTSCFSLTMSIIFFSLILNILAIEVKGSVPVLIWKDEKAPINSPSASTVNIPLAVLQEKYLSTFNPDNILLFLLDELSVEDLSSHEDVFKFVGDSMEKGHLLYIPAVEDTGLLVHNLSLDGYNVNTIERGAGVAGLKLKEDSKNLVVVELPSTAGTRYKSKAMQKTDEVIANVLSKVGQAADFTVIFTAKEAPAALQVGVEHRRTSRSLQQSGASTDYQWHYTDCVLLYLRNDIVYEKGNTSYTLYNNKTTRPTLADCRNNVSFIFIKYKGLDDFETLRINLTFVTTGRRWTFKNAEIYESVDRHEEANTIILRPVWPMEEVPFNKSYTCSQKMVLVSNTTATQNIYRLSIYGMQVEAFSGGREVFSAGWDCVGFFTIPIWTGIFTGVLFAFILAVGMFMLSEVKTMDRFDDPKGKHIMATGGGPSE